ncbi:MAG: hypothetical protein EA425_17370 [Puniceicoccaceae bacterium]|nr:MAG: hypothetical protein EA425_17370 [Puniceicoccaceae bacterium]
MEFGMKRRILVLGLILACAIPGWAEEREWTDDQGRTMRAWLIGIEDGQAIFLMNEREWRFDLERLSAEDRAWIRENPPRRGAREAARAASEQPPPSPLLESMQDLLVVSAGNSFRRARTEDLERSEYFLFYYSASWCGPCVRFTPELIRTVRQLESAAPGRLAVVLVGSDRSERAMARYMSSSGMPWPAIRFGRQRDVPVVAGAQIRYLPGMLLVDREGNPVASTAEMDRGRFMQVLNERVGGRS